MTKICLICKKEYKRRGKVALESKFCSRICKTIYFKGKHLSPSTELKRGHQMNKGKKLSEDHKKLIGFMNRKGIVGMLGKHHSVETRRKISQAQSGNKSINWKGGISKSNEIERKSVEYKLWRQTVYERDGFECQICGQIGNKLEANHIKKFADFPHLRFEINNGITLCERCHKLWVNRRETEWESYFNFNISIR